MFTTVTLNRGHFDEVVDNDGTLAELHQKADLLAARLRNDVANTAATTVPTRENIHP